MELRNLVLDMIGNVEVANDPWCFEYTLNILVEEELGDEAHTDLQRCLSELEDEGLIEHRVNARGESQYALSSALQHPEYLRDQCAYDSLKDAVLTEAQRRGFRPKWHPDRSWQLLMHGQIVYEGPIRSLAQRLGIAVAE